MRVFVLAFMLTMLMPAIAWAQDTFCAAATSCTTAVSSTSGTTIVGIGTTMLSRIRDRKVAAIGRYARLNEVAILAALARGGGDVLADLADLAGVRDEDVPAFISRLREQRERLNSAFAPGAEPRYLAALVLHAAEE